MNENDITYKIRGAIFKVYNELGPGLLESVYEAALLYQLREDGLQVESQKKLDVYYDGHLLPIDFRLDIIVEDKVIIELKSVELLKDVHKKQLLTYLKISGKKVGLLVNFNTTDLSKDIVRIVNGLEELSQYLSQYLSQIAQITQKQICEISEIREKPKYEIREKECCYSPLI